MCINRGEWAACEAASRQALSLDADCILAQNLLSSALTFQNRPDELAQNIGARLARDPNDSLTHNAAGWAALRAGDRRKAETHFLEALRLDASNESARLGLLDAFRSRSIIYRAHLRFSFFAASLAEKHRMFLFLGIYVIYQFAKNAAKAVSPVLVWLVVAVYLTFVLWSYIGRGVGTLLVLADPRARQALKAPGTLGRFSRRRCRDLGLRPPRGRFACAGLRLNWFGFYRSPARRDVRALGALSVQ